MILKNYIFDQVCVFSILFIFWQHRLVAQQSVENKFYTQSNSYRMAAEWEPALGTMVAWPLSVPYKLVVELAADNKLYTLVENESNKLDAARWYVSWGIDTSRVTFIYAPQGIDVSWVRDWGPHAVFSPQGKMMLGDGKYIYSTPVSEISCTDQLGFLYKDGDKIIKTETEDNATIPLGNQIEIEVLDLPFISTGGNVMTDGLGAAFSSCILTNENRFYGVNDSKFFEINKSLLGIENYHILSNFEKHGIQHIDCLMKVLDEERIMVVQPPGDHELYPIYEDIVKNELSVLKNNYGRPYKIVRMGTFRYKNEELAAYSNSLILNKTIYVPLFSIPEDSLALKRWRELMPGYTVKGFEFILKNEPGLDPRMLRKYNAIGWTHGDALHCRTRAIWDPDMLFISAQVLDDEVVCNKNNTISATIIDYSKNGVIKEKVILHWREKGTNSWQKIIMNSVGNDQHYEVNIPCQKSGTEIEYFVSAESKSAKKESRPATAPGGYFTAVFK